MEVPKANCDGRPLLVDLKREVDLVQLHTDVIEEDVDDEVTMFRLMLACTNFNTRFEPNFS